MNANHLTFDEQLISDLHKDAYGFRPGQQWWAAFSQMTDEEKQSTWDYLLKAVEESINEDAQREAEAAADFWKLVEKTIAEGAGDKQTAIRWIQQGLGEYVDADEACWALGLNYNMAHIFKEAASAA